MLSSGSLHNRHRGLSQTPPEPLQALHDRSESRCSRASVDTIDDVQQYFDVAIAAGEKQLRHEQGAISPPSVVPESATNARATTPTTAQDELTKMTDELTILTDQLDEEEEIAGSVAAPDLVESHGSMQASKPAHSDEPTQEDVNAAVAQLNMSIGDDEGSDGSLVPDGENFVVASSKLPSGGKLVDTNEKPMEEISYGFDNPFRGVAAAVPSDNDVVRNRRDSQVSDSTLPDSEHTDRPQSSSLHSSSLHSDEEPVTETGEGYETTGTERVSQSEAETSAADTFDSTTSTKANKRGMFMQGKGHDVEKGSLRGIPGQESEDSKVKSRAASFNTSKFSEKTSVTNDRKPEASRPSSVFAILSSQKATSEASKRLSTSPAPNTAHTSTVANDSTTSAALYSRPLPVYNRMSRQDSNKSDSASAPSPTTSGPKAISEPKALASLIADSMKSGEASRSMRRQSETAGKPMFFKAGRNSRVELPTTPDRIENVIKLDTTKYETKVGVVPQPSNISSGSQATVVEKKSPPPTAIKPTKPGASLNRKESLKEQYNKLQENMAKWQDRLKDNESRVKELTTSQQNLATADLSLAVKPSSETVVKSASTSSITSKQPFVTSNETHFVPPELQKTSTGQTKSVKLRSAAERFIPRTEPELDPVESLMKTIRDRAGRASDCAPDRGIYVAAGQSAESVSQSITQREVAPSSHSGVVPAAPPVQPALKIPTIRSNQTKLMNGTSKTNNPRFNPPPATRDSLLAEIANAGGIPASRRQIPIDSSSSSDELKEIKVRHKPQKAHKHKNSKRSVSDPFPPPGPNNRNHLQPTPTQLDPREELMIAVRDSGGLSKLRQVNADEIKWSAQV